MFKKDVIIKEIEKVPEQYYDEVLDFIRFLEIKTLEKMGTAIASESSLKKDWLKDEEEKYWKDLSITPP